MPIATVHGGGEPQGLDSWFRALPIVTQYWFGATLLLTLAGNMGIIDPSYLTMDWTQVTRNLQLWRCLTSACFAGGFSWHTVTTLYMLVTMSRQYEAGGPFNTGAGSGTADYVFAFLVALVLTWITFPLMFLILLKFPAAKAWTTPYICTHNLVFFVMYVWSKRHPRAHASIWGISIPAAQLPFAYFALTVLLGEPWYVMAHGMMVGHMYYFMADVYPKVYGRDLLQTPHFLIKQLGVGEYRHTTPRAPPVAPARRGEHQWGGSGRRLGGD